MPGRRLPLATRSVGSDASGPIWPHQREPLVARRGQPGGNAQATWQARAHRRRCAVAKLVYDFTEGNRDMKDLLGGKGANLAEMTNLGLPVPAGFTITTDACRHYLRE